METDTFIYRLPVEKSELALIIQASIYPLSCNFSVVCIFLMYNGTWQFTIRNFDYTDLISWVNHAWTKVRGVSQGCISAISLVDKSRFHNHKREFSICVTQ